MSRPFILKIYLEKDKQIEKPKSPPGKSLV